MKEKIIITGGAGYIGSVLTNTLLEENYQVKVLDNLMHGGDHLVQNLHHSNFKFVKGDIRDPNFIRKNIQDGDIIIHLAAIVGYPACSNNPKLAYETNVEGTLNVSKALSKNQLILFGSTGSNYGDVDHICTEETKLNPLTVYAKTKVEAEKYITNNNESISYRFATAFGVSPRMRLDLLVNDFVYKAISQNYLVVYEKKFMRTFIHVRDIAKSFLHAIENRNIMKNNVFNVGEESLNYSKEDICKKINKKIDFYLYFADIGKDKDRRNYIVSYEKIRNTGFKLQYDLEFGIEELIEAIPLLETKLKYFNA